MVNIDDVPEPFDNRAAWCWVAQRSRILYTGGTSSARAWMLTPHDPQWTLEIYPDMHSPRGTHASISIGIVPYVFGGSGPTAKCEKLVNRTWEMLPDMHTPRSYCSCTETSGKIFVAGNGSEFLEEFNPTTHVFRVL
ncbi:MAG: hypothetical protein V2I33_17995 [Kangiellaceae bacterium]|jgi:hypothetical protein|nr:hypothetical protein [Kangiellaceae bacterium]